MAKKTKRGEHHDLALTFTAVLVIAGVMVLQILARRLKRFCEGQRHASDILEASERELSVLGLIAFGLFVLERGYWKGEWYTVFHEVHFALFTVALFYVGLNVSLYRMSRSRGRLWRALERKDVADHAGVVKRLRELKKRLRVPALDHHLLFGSYWLRGLCRHPLVWLEYQRCLEHMTFHEVRRDFLRVHHLPHAFSFAAYLESCLQHVCIEFSEIRDTVWFLGILGLITHLFFTTMLATPSAETTLTWLGGTVIFLSVLAFFKVKWIYWYVLHSELLFATKNDDEERPSAASADPVAVHHPPPADVSLSVRKRQKSPQLSLFWFKNPGFVVTLLELCLFALSSSVALLVYKMKSFYKSGDLATPLSVVAAAFFSIVILLPRIVPRFTLITHVGELSDPRRIASVIRKQQLRGDFLTRDDGEETKQQVMTPKLSKTGRSFKELRESTSHVSHRVSKRVRKTCEDPRISNASAVAVVFFVFMITVTLDEDSAGSVLENGHVLVLRDVELFLGCCFVVEASMRFWFRPRDSARQVDLFLVYATVACNIASFALRPQAPHKILHAASSAIILRIFNTAWHNEVAKPRFEHLRLSTQDLLTSHMHHEGGGHGHGKDHLHASSSHRHDLEGGASTPKQPDWVVFYAHPSVKSHTDLVTVGAEDNNSERYFAAKTRATDLVTSALASSAADSDSNGGTVDDVVERALRVALQRVTGPWQAGLPDVVTDDAADAKDVQRITSTRDEELEDALYFNQVLKMAKAATSREMKRRFSSITNSLNKKRFSFFGGLGAADEKAEDADVDVRLILTRDQVVWYDAAGEISELVGDSGKVRRVPAADARDIKAVALEAPDAARPEGHLHLSTILKVDTASGGNLVLTTTSHVATFQLDSNAVATQWKRAVLDAIDREDDDDPLHPLAACADAKASDFIINQDLSLTVDEGDETTDDDDDGDAA